VNDRVLPIRDDDAYEQKLKELMASYPQITNFDMAPYRLANEYACTTRFSKVATSCICGDWKPLMEWAIETSKESGIDAAVELWFKVTARVKKEWVFRKQHYGNPHGPKSPFS
jgi:hypothetical protein